MQPPDGRLGTVRLSAVAPTVSAGLLVTLVHVPPMVVLDTDMPVSVSVKLALVSAVAFEFPSVKVIVEVPPTGILVGANALLIVGPVRTVRVALLDGAPAVGTSVVVTPLVWFGWVPAALLVTWTVIVQPPDGKLGTVRFSAVAPIVSAGLLVTPTHVPPIVASVSEVVAL